MLCDLAATTRRRSTGPQRDSGDSQSTYNPALAADGGRWSSRPSRGERTMIVARDAGGRDARSSAGCGRAAPATATPTTRCCRPTARGWPTRSPAGAWAIRARRARGCRCATCATGARARPAGGRRRLAANPGASRPTGASSRTWLEPGAARAPRAARCATWRSGRDAAHPDRRRAAAGPGRRRRRRASWPSPRCATGARRSAAWTAATGTLQVVSRASGARGRRADGWSEGPSISGDGRRVAFASTAANLDPPSATTRARSSSATWRRTRRGWSATRRAPTRGAAG